MWRWRCRFGGSKWIRLRDSHVCWIYRKSFKMVLFQRDCRWYCMYVLISTYTYITYLPGSSRSVKCVPKFNQKYYKAGHTSLIFGRSYSERFFEYHWLKYIYIQMCVHIELQHAWTTYSDSPGHIMEVISLSHTKCYQEILLMLERKIQWSQKLGWWYKSDAKSGRNFLFCGAPFPERCQHQIYRPLAIQEVP